MSQENVEGRVRRGVDAIRRDYETVEETWDEHRIATEELIDAGDRIVRVPGYMDRAAARDAAGLGSTGS